MQNKRLLFVLLSISLFLISGCSNKNGELAKQLKDDGYYVVRYSKADDDSRGWLVLKNYKELDFDNVKKGKDSGVYIGVTYKENSEELKDVLFSNYSVNNLGANSYCVYGGYDNCFADSVYSKEEKETEIAAQPKMKKDFNKFLKKYDITKDEFMDLVQYIYDNDGKLE